MEQQRQHAVIKMELDVRFKNDTSINMRSDPDPKLTTISNKQKNNLNSWANICVEIKYASNINNQKLQQQTGHTPKMIQ